MTRANAPQKLYIPQPFASGTGAAYTAIGNSTSENVNFVDGFPSAYGAPAGGGGKFITRGEMNAIGHLASVNEYFRDCGGITTFSQRLCTKIGGYPQGAVLDYLSGNTLCKVVSLVDNNTVDFTGSPVDLTIPSNPCSSGTVDGNSWAYCATVNASMRPNWSNLHSTELGVIADQTTKDTYVRLGGGRFLYDGYVKCAFDSTYQSQGLTRASLVLGGLSGVDVSNTRPDSITLSSDAAVISIYQTIDAFFPVPVSSGVSWSLWMFQPTGATIGSTQIPVRLFK